MKGNLLVTFITKMNTNAPGVTGVCIRIVLLDD